MVKNYLIRYQTRIFQINMKNLNKISLVTYELSYSIQKNLIFVAPGQMSIHFYLPLRFKCVYK